MGQLIPEYILGASLSMIARKTTAWGFFSIFTLFPDPIPI